MAILGREVSDSLKVTTHMERGKRREDQCFAKHGILRRF
jgi:hypothetical protein